jgi:hypothetical protein
MTKADRVHSTPPTNATTESELLARLAKVGMRLEQLGDHYRLLHGNCVLLQRGPEGYGLSLEQIEIFTRRALRQ